MLKNKAFTLFFITIFVLCQSVYNVQADGKRNRVFQADDRKNNPSSLVDYLTSHLYQRHLYQQI